jgi:hypothetical protein
MIVEMVRAPKSTPGDSFVQASQVTILQHKTNLLRGCAQSLYDGAPGARCGGQEGNRGNSLVYLIAVHLPSKQLSGHIGSFGLKS